MLNQMKKSGKQAQPSAKGAGKTPASAAKGKRDEAKAPNAQAFGSFLGAAP